MVRILGGQMVQIWGMIVQFLFFFHGYGAVPRPRRSIRSMDLASAIPNPGQYTGPWIQGHWIGLWLKFVELDSGLDTPDLQFCAPNLFAAHPRWIQLVRPIRAASWIQFPRVAGADSMDSTVLWTPHICSSKRPSQPQLRERDLDPVPLDQRQGCSGSSSSRSSLVQLAYLRLQALRPNHVGTVPATVVSINHS